MVNPLLNPDVAPPPDDEPNDTTEKKKFVADAHYDLFYVPEAVAELDFDGLTDDEKNLILRIKDMREGMVKYDQATFQNTITKLREALFKGFKTEIATQYGTEDNITYNAMELNVNRFGFDKTVAEVIDLNLAFKETKTFNEFKKRAATIIGKYNRVYLKTEYDTAVSVAQNAAAWNRFKADEKLYPYLKYQTAGDSRVRPEHAALDGRIFRISKHKEWDGIYPPNGYNCRCEMIQLSYDEATSKTNRDYLMTGEQAKESLGETWDKMERSGFAVNRGETHIVFDLNKTYLGSLPDDDVKEKLGGEILKLKDIDYKIMQYPAYDKMDKTNMPQLARDKFATPEQILKKFDDEHRELPLLYNRTTKKTQNEKALVYTDYAGRSLGISKDVLSKHLQGDYINEVKERHHIFISIKDVLETPDEVWMLYSEGAPNYTYIKFYKDEMMAVPVEVDGRLKIKSWYKVTKEDSEVRKGVPIYKK
ncbi:MAG TPA: phage minor head protein [Bacteroidia bacterium]|nr:phage minor head protein [Bacteroidia bacterium]HMU19268.1 phage minor head protein [Bacteroidia bacterium]